MTELLPQARVHPPVQHGDLLRLDLDTGDTVLILDGFFQQAPAVRHKEILHLVHRGVRVVGAGSMGALRAAELSDHGVVGVGHVFGWYADGTVTGDDEVAVSHLSAEEGHRQLSDALVSLRYGLGRAAGSAITEAERDALVKVVAELPFPQRGWTSLWRITEGTPLAGAAARARDYLQEHPRHLDVKRVDAELALRWVRDNPAVSSPAPRPSTLDTVYLADWLWENSGAEVRGQHVSDRHALGFLQLFLPAYPEIHRLSALAAIGGTADGALAAARARGLLGPDDEPTAGMREWLADAELAAEPGRELVLRALVRSFRTAPGVRTGHSLPAMVAASPELLGLARNITAVAASMNEAKSARQPGFRVEHIRGDLVEQFFTDRWGCQGLEHACWDRGLTGIGDLHELGAYFFLLARSGRLPEQALSAVAVGTPSGHGERIR
ncbi:TfuA-like protein [Nonomuraea sp. NPDC047897]|uniref:TfuA-like protein n=1 Tax=Nonomuraea sp. NPDC047897 TaxID=3364346 RepID=UPI003723D340